MQGATPEMVTGMGTAATNAVNWAHDERCALWIIFFTKKPGKTGFVLS